ncbi:MAG: HAMP domain-containing histidine kinase, partial [Proteobacteria bacterium]
MTKLAKSIAMAWSGNLLIFKPFSPLLKRIAINWRVGNCMETISSHEMIPAAEPKERKAHRELIATIQKLSHARKIETIVEIVAHAARKLTGADGATFILREGDSCHYVDEDAIGPLWKGRRFPLTACISGWAMLNHESAMIEDIYQDSRIPADAYRPTFVKSLVMVPVRKENPIAAIGNYWSTHHKAEPEEIELLQSLADSASIAIENTQLYTQLRECLDETRSARDELARQLNLRDEFISVAAHELKTPLTPLKLQVQFLSKLIAGKQFEDEGLKKTLTHISNVTSRQTTEFARRIEDLLDASRIRLGKFTVDPEPGVDFNQLAHTVVTDYESVNPGRILFHPSGELVGFWDPARLEQVIRNLISNALRYGEKNPIEFSTHREGSTAVFSVRDYGPGVRPEDQSRIFDRFERASSIKSFGGLGLGLFISRQILQEHQGSIRVLS